MMAKPLNLCGPNLNPKTRINICGLDISMLIFYRNNEKYGADKLAKNYPNAPKFICPSPKERLHEASVVHAMKLDFFTKYFQVTSLHSVPESLYSFRFWFSRISVFYNRKFKKKS